MFNKKIKKRIAVMLSVLIIGVPAASSVNAIEPSTGQNLEDNMEMQEIAISVEDEKNQTEIIKENVEENTDLNNEERNLLEKEIKSGLNTYLNTYYDNLSDEEKVTKGNDILNYVKEIDDNLDFSMGYFVCSDIYSSMDKYLKQNFEMNYNVDTKADALSKIIQNYEDVISKTGLNEDVFKEKIAEFISNVDEDKKIELESMAKEIGVEVLEEQENMPEEPLNQAEQRPVQRMAMRGYNVSKAMSYADRYNGYKRNSSRYGNFSGEGGDCTNFVSQCLKDGNLAFVGNQYNNKNHWFHNGGKDYSLTWIRASSFKNHWASRNGCSEHFVRSDAKKFPYSVKSGDVISLRNANGDIFHTIFVMRKHQKNVDWGYAAHDDHFGANTTSILKRTAGKKIVIYHL